MSVFLGIDFGSVACRTVLLRDGVLEVVRNRFDERGLPPVTPVMGAKAMHEDLNDGGFPLAFASLKQELGSLQLVDTVAGRHHVGDKIAEILSQVREDVLSAINEPLDGTVLGIPGFYTDCPRAALREAAHTAGFSTVRLVDEGLAAVLGAAQPVERGTALVYALGAGVFSASVVAVENGRGNVLSSEGNRLLGGNQFDTALASLILKRLATNADFPHPREAAKHLLDVAHDVKEGLSRREESLFDINLAKLFGNGDVESLAVTRSDFEGLIADSVNVTLDLAKKCLQTAGVPAASLDRIVLVGDSTGIPYVESLVAREFGAAGIRAGTTDVARGAALFGGRLGTADWKRRESVADEPEQPVPVQLPPPARRAPEHGTWLAKFAPQFIEAETRWNGGDRRGSIRTVEGLCGELGAYLGTLYHSEAQGFMRDHNFGEAVDFLGRAVRLTVDPDDRERYGREYHLALNRRTAQLIEAGRFEEALLVIRKGLEINAKCPSCLKLYEIICRELKISVPGKPGKKRR
jgi:hypothetical protein